jgi:hypothetical protein
MACGQEGRSGWLEERKRSRTFHFVTTASGFGQLAAQYTDNPPDTQPRE